MRYRVLYSEASLDQVRSLHPSIKPVVKARIEQLQENPYLGRALQRELSGYFSYRAQRFRIIYRIDESNKTLQVHHVGHRRDVFELLRAALA